MGLPLRHCEKEALDYDEKTFMDSNLVGTCDGDCTCVDCDRYCSGIMERKLGML